MQGVKLLCIVAFVACVSAAPIHSKLQALAETTSTKGEVSLLTGRSCEDIKVKADCLSNNQKSFDNLPCTWCPGNRILNKCRYDPIPKLTCSAKDAADGAPAEEVEMAPCDIFTDLRNFLGKEKATIPKHKIYGNTKGETSMWKSCPTCDACQGDNLAKWRTFLGAGYENKKCMDICEPTTFNGAHLGDVWCSWTNMMTKRACGQEPEEIVEARPMFYEAVKTICADKCQDCICGGDGEAGCLWCTNVCMNKIQEMAYRCEPTMQVLGRRGMLVQGGAMLLATAFSAASAVVGPGASIGVTIGITSASIVSSASLSAVQGKSWKEIMAGALLSGASAGLGFVPAAGDFLGPISGFAIDNGSAVVSELLDKNEDGNVDVATKKVVYDPSSKESTVKDVIVPEKDACSIKKAKTGKCDSQ